MTKNELNLEEIKQELIRKNEAFQDAIKPYIEKNQNYKDYFEQVEKNLENLNNSKYKICVVGTMNAGKSTIINAIIGEQIAPSREEAMTYLPTLITRSDNKSKTLNIKNAAALNELLKEIKSKIPVEDRSELIRLYRAAKKLMVKQPKSYIESENSKEFLNDIASGFSFKEQYLEDDKDFNKAMFYLNDIFRIANEFNIQTDWNKFSNTNNLPDIKVEFSALEKLKFSKIVDFALVDTPGPNEAGASEVLKGIFQEQIKNSNAVICAIDNTQKETDASSEITSQVKEILNIKSKNAFIFINKFDKKPNESLKARAEEETYANDFSIPKENVFAISAKNAYLSQSALIQLKKNIEIDEEILEELFGAAFEDIPKEKYKERLEKMLKESNFQNAVDKAIIETYNNSSKNFIKEEADNLIEICKLATDELNISLNNLEKPLEQLENELKKFASSIEELKKSTQEVKEKSKDIMNIEEATEKITDKFSKNLGEDYIDISLNILKNYPELNSSNSFKNNADGAKVLIGKIQRDTLLKLNDEAKKFSSDFENYIKSYIKNFNEIIEKELSGNLKQVRDILNIGNKEDVIALPIPIFKMKNLDTDIKFNSISIQSETKTEDKDGGFAKFTRAVDIFGLNWGKEDNTYYNLDKNDVKDNIRNALLQAPKFVRNQMIEVAKKIKEQSEDEIRRLEHKVDGYEENMQNMINLKQGGKFDKEKEKKDLQGTRDNINEIKSYIEDTINKKMNINNN